MAIRAMRVAPVLAMELGLRLLLLQTDIMRMQVLIAVALILTAGHVVLLLWSLMAVRVLSLPYGHIVIAISKRAEERKMNEKNKAIFCKRKTLS